MNRDDIIRMAREAGWDLEWGGTTIEQVQNFAALVAAAEREACVRLCRELVDAESDESYRLAITWCISFIKARGGE